MAFHLRQIQWLHTLDTLSGRILTVAFQAAEDSRLHNIDQHRTISSTMCIKVTYRALCGHYTSPVYDFCHVANEQAKSRTRGLAMHLWRWSGRYHSQLDCSCRRVQPCNRVKEKRKRNDPYWNKRVCEACQRIVRDGNKKAGTQHRRASRSYR